jgi:hypothetical protein
LAEQVRKNKIGYVVMGESRENRGSGVNMIARLEERIGDRVKLLVVPA